jgi:hypothetical protein
VLWNDEVLRDVSHDLYKHGLLDRKLVQVHIDVYLTADRFFVQSLKQAVVGKLSRLADFLQTSSEAGQLAELVFQTTQPRDPLRALFTKQIARCLILHEAKAVSVIDHTKLLQTMAEHEQMAWEVCNEAIQMGAERRRETMDYYWDTDED